MFKYTKLPRSDTNHISQIVDEYLDFEIEKRLRQLVAGKEDEPSPEILKIAHITGPLIILCIGEICALLAFIGEHLRIRRGKKILGNNNVKLIKDQ